MTEISDELKKIKLEFKKNRALEEKIKILHLEDGQYHIGPMNGITKIVANIGHYVEDDFWFDIYNGDDIMSRVNAKFVETIVFDTEGEN